MISIATKTQKIDLNGSCSISIVHVHELSRAVIPKVADIPLGAMSRDKGPKMINEVLAGRKRSKGEEY